MERTKAFRRSCEKKAKNKAKKSLMAKWPMDEKTDDRRIGRLASTHCKPCSCEMCGNPRKWLGLKSLQERRSEMDSEIYEDEDDYFE